MPGDWVGWIVVVGLVAAYVFFLELLKPKPLTKEKDSAHRANSGVLP